MTEKNRQLNQTINMETDGMDTVNVLVYGPEGASDLLEYMLKSSGYKVIRVQTEKELFARFGEESTAMLLFDFQTEAGSDKEALRVLSGLRQESDKPIMAIMNKEREMLRILALNSGADDILEHDCSAMESLARIQAQIRVYKRLSKKTTAPALIKMDGLEIDDNAKVVRINGVKADLTPTEYKILYLLMKEPGRVLSNKQIYEMIWKMEPIGADNTVAVHIRHIREKIEDNPQKPKYLQVVWGQGYKVG